MISKNENWSTFNGDFNPGSLARIPDLYTTVPPPSVRDLGVQVSSDLRPMEHCIIANNRANKIQGYNSWRVTNRSSEVILKFYLVLVRRHLDYAAQFLSIYFRKDICSLESREE